MDKYTMISEFPVFTGKTEHVHTVCTRPSLSQREGPGDEAMTGAQYPPPSIFFCGLMAYIRKQ